MASDIESLQFFFLRNWQKQRLTFVLYLQLLWAPELFTSFRISYVGLDGEPISLHALFVLGD